MNIGILWISSRIDRIYFDIRAWRSNPSAGRRWATARVEKAMGAARAPMLVLDPASVRRISAQ
jgi:hypothetical protein